jgi:hypothetical protein
LGAFSNEIHGMNPGLVEEIPAEQARHMAKKPAAGAGQASRLSPKSEKNDGPQYLAAVRGHLPSAFAALRRDKREKENCLPSP